MRPRCRSAAGEVVGHRPTAPSPTPPPTNRGGASRTARGSSSPFPSPVGGKGARGIGGRRRYTQPSSSVQIIRAPTVSHKPAGSATLRANGWLRSRKDAGMRIREIRAVGLFGATPEGGWSNELRPEDSVHTLVAVLTDEGVTGLGGVFTNAGSGAGGAGGAGTALPGRERAGAGAGQREAAPAHLLDGARRLDHPRDQRHRHRPLGHPRQGDRATGRPAARRPLPRAGAALRLDPDGRAGAADRAPAGGQGAGLPRLQDRLGTVRPGEPRAGRGDRARRRARRSGRTSSSWSMPAAATPSGRTATSGRCARRRCWPPTTSPGSRKPLQPDALEDFVHLRRSHPPPDHRRRDADAAAVVPAVAAGGAPSTSSSRT